MFLQTSVDLNFTQYLLLSIMALLYQISDTSFRKLKEGLLRNTCANISNQIIIFICFLQAITVWNYEIIINIIYHLWNDLKAVVGIYPCSQHVSEIYGIYINWIVDSSFLNTINMLVTRLYEERWIYSYV